MSRIPTPRAGTSRSRLRLGAVATLAVVSATAGCYQYQPAELQPAPPIGEDVRVVVSRESATEFAQAIDVTDSPAPFIIGRLERVEDDALMLRVPLPPSQYQTSVYSEVGQLLRVPTAHVLGIERREFDRFRSTLLVGGAVAGATAILLGIIDTSGSSPDDDGGVLLLRLPLSLGGGR